MTTAHKSVWDHGAMKFCVFGKPVGSTDVMVRCSPVFAAHLFRRVAKNGLYAALRHAVSTGKLDIWHLQTAIMHFALYIFVSAICVAGVQAQEIPTDKKFEIINSTGVNLHDLQYSEKYDDISIGSGEFPSKLQLQREYKQVSFFPIYYPATATSAPFASHSSHNFILAANCFPCDMGTQTTIRGQTVTTSSQPQHFMTVKAFDGVHSFKSPPAYWGTARVWTNRYNDGATLTDDGDHVVLTTKMGDKITYSHIEPNGTGLGCGGACAVAIYAVFASGESIVFSYDKLPTPPVDDTTFWYPTLGQSAWGASRLTSVVNSRGYGLSFQYLNPSITAGDMQTRMLISSVSGFRASCVSGVVACGSGSMPQVFYNYNVVSTQTGSGYKVYRLTSFTNPNGDIFRYEYGGPEFRLSRSFLANSTQYASVENTYDLTAPDQHGYYSGKVLSQKNSLGKITNYSGGSVPNDNSPTTTTVVAPDGAVEVLHFDGTRSFKFTLPSLIELPLGRQLIYSYDFMMRPTSATDASGVSEVYNLDDRGNITQLTRNPKPGSLEAATSENWFYPDCNASNTKICNKPQYYIDKRSKRTDYSYDSGHGGILTVLSPADAQNYRSVKRYYYSSFYPAPGISAPPGNSLVSAFLPTAIDTCTSSTVTGTAIDFNFACPVVDRVRTKFIYTTSTTSSRTNYELEGSVEDADGAAALTCYRYDAIGNRIAQTTPRAALSTCN